MKKPKYKIGELLYYFNRSKNKIQRMAVCKIIITETCIRYACEYSKVVVDEESLKRTTKKVIQKVLGKEYAYTKVFELLVDKENKDE